MRRFFSIYFILYLLAMTCAYSQIPKYIPFGGKIISDGKVITGLLDFRVSLYKKENVNYVPVFENEVHSSVAVLKGDFSIKIGTVNQSDFQNLLFNEPYFISIEYSSDGQNYANISTDPYIPLGSVPFAFTGQNAFKLAGANQQELMHSFEDKIIEVAAANSQYIIPENERINKIFVSDHSSDVEIILPEAEKNYNREILIMKLDNNAGNVIINTPDGSLLNWDAQLIINNENSGYRLLCTGSRWVITDRIEESNLDSIVHNETYAFESNNNNPKYITIQKSGYYRIIAWGIFGNTYDSKYEYSYSVRNWNSYVLIYNSSDNGKVLAHADHGFNEINYTSDYSKGRGISIAAYYYGYLTKGTKVGIFYSSECQAHTDYIDYKVTSAGYLVEKINDTEN